MVDYRLKCAELEKKLRALELENARLKALLGMGSAMEIQSPAIVPFEPTDSGETHPKPTPALWNVTKHSPLEDKIALYRALFFGREDVFARRWQSQKTGKSGYSPACANEWKPGICPKPKGTCGKCKTRQLLPLSDIAVERHLRGNDPLGRDVVGIYPILPEDTCRFLALDFDEGEWQENVIQLRKLCEK